MFRPINIIGIAVLFILGLFSLVFSQESITITTYYPSPYGSYNELTVTNKAGIGTTSPASTLHVVKQPTTPGGAMYYADALYIESIYSSDTTTYIGLKPVNTSGAKVGINFYSSAGYGKRGEIEMNTNDSTNQDLSIRNIHNGAGSDILILPTNGNVGIGTASPTAKLHVSGNIKAVLSDIDGAAPANMRYNTGSNEIGYDVAELFEANEEVEPGDILSIDENGRLKRSTSAYDSKVAGIVSEAPAVLFEGSQLQIAPQPFEFKKGNKPPLALAGRVKCKVTTQDGGPIKIGDLLVASSKPGYAMRAELEKIRFGTVIGKALEPLNEADGKITVLVTLQ